MELGPKRGLQSTLESLQALKENLKESWEEYDTQRAKTRLSHALVSYTLRLLLGKRRASARAGPSPTDMLRDTLRWGAFIGSFSGGYVFFDEAIALLGGTERCGNLPGAHPHLRPLLAPTRFEHGDVVLMCLSTVQIAYSWMIKPQTFPPSYQRFLDKQGGKPPFAYAGMRELASLSAAAPGPHRLDALKGTPHQDFCSSIPCSFWHPGHTCATHIPSYWPMAYLRALPVYLPVYLIPALFVHRRALVNPSTAPQIWKKLAAGILRSSLFLSMYCTLAFAGACIGFRSTGRTTGAVIAGFTWIAGLAVLLEKKSRRMELALYCLSRVVEAFGLCLIEWGYLTPRSLPRRTDVILFSLATASICHCYSDYCGARRQVFRSPYLTVFDFMLGNTGKAVHRVGLGGASNAIHVVAVRPTMAPWAGFYCDVKSSLQGFKESSIRHHPSNVDLINALERRLARSSLTTWAASLLRGLVGGSQTPSGAGSPSSSSSGGGSDAGDGSPRSSGGIPRSESDGQLAANGHGVTPVAAVLAVDCGADGAGAGPAAFAAGPSNGTAGRRREGGKGAPLGSHPVDDEST
ncbi:hypothetical protein N2152v2_007311 [Parachlorella kessleri]